VWKARGRFQYWVAKKVNTGVVFGKGANLLTIPYRENGLIEIYTGREISP